MERQFDIQIEKLKKKILKMCSLVDEQVEFSIKAIDENDHELAKLVIERDVKVDKYDVKIEKICQKIFALNQPVAMDLRLIMSAITINTNLERIGDIAVNIAENFLILKSKPDFISATKYFEMSRLVQEMIRNAIDSFIQNDPKLAQKVIRTDSIIDKYNIDNHQILIELMKENPNNIEPAVALLVISRQLERLGDHATNVAEDVFFIVEAEMIKHKYEKFIMDDNADEEDDDDEFGQRIDK
ncbi:MAG TPA: phosphate signaling complex protein PhoU [Ignavibacteriaceae bacterium]|nr:phosphate signaling complex protein PhoU [Ignavibacteriaceae bacterium]